MCVRDSEKGKRRSEIAPNGIMPDALGRVKMSYQKAFWPGGKAAAKTCGSPVAQAPVSEEIRPTGTARAQVGGPGKEAGWDGDQPVHQEDGQKKEAPREDAPVSRGGALGSHPSS